MICDCCGAEYADNLLSCPYCGTATAVSDDTPDARCPRCAAPVMQGQPMCQQCGLALDLHQQRVQMQNMYNNHPQSMPNPEYDQNGQPKLQNQQNPQVRYNQPNRYNQPYNANQILYTQNTSKKPKYNPDDPAQARNARICLIVAAAALAIAFISPIVAIMLATMALKYANGTACATARTVGIIAIIAAIVCAGFSTMSINISLD